MSKLILKSEPILMSNYSLANNIYDNTYYFKLKININNNEYYFANSENKKYSNLIKYNNKIKFDEINNFEIEIKLQGSIFKLNGHINKESSCYIDQANNIYVEFSQDANGYVNCICYFIDKDLTSLCITPPN
jgi:hypothetical protein